MTSNVCTRLVKRSRLAQATAIALVDIIVLLNNGIEVRYLEKLQSSIYRQNRVVLDVVVDGKSMVCISETQGVSP